MFLQQRNLRDLQHDAMVAVFLRHIEYYRGILFLTTSRVETFDDAFLSRIHITLRFKELSKEAKMQAWRNFLEKAGVEITPDLDVPKVGLSQAQLGKLADRKINARQIKNATRTAKSLAFSRGQPLGFVHLMETLDAMEEEAPAARSMEDV